MNSLVVVDDQLAILFRHGKLKDAIPFRRSGQCNGRSRTIARDIAIALRKVFRHRHFGSDGHLEGFAFAAFQGEGLGVFAIVQGKAKYIIGVIHIAGDRLLNGQFHRVQLPDGIQGSYILVECNASLTQLVSRRRCVRIFVPAQQGVIIPCEMRGGSVHVVPDGNNTVSCPILGHIGALTAVGFINQLYGIGGPLCLELHEVSCHQHIASRLIDGAIGSFPANKSQTRFFRNTAIFPYLSILRKLYRCLIDGKITLIYDFLGGVISANARQITDLTIGATPLCIKFQNTVFIHMVGAYSRGEVKGNQLTILIPIPSKEAILHSGWYQLVVNLSAFRKALPGIGVSIVHIEVILSTELVRLPLGVEVHICGNGGILVGLILRSRCKLRGGVPSGENVPRFRHGRFQGFQQVSILVVDLVTIKIRFVLRISFAVDIVICPDVQRQIVSVIQKDLTVIAFGYLVGECFFKLCF